MIGAYTLVGTMPDEHGTPVDHLICEECGAAVLDRFGSFARDKHTGWHTTATTINAPITDVASVTSEAHVTVSSGPGRRTAYVHVDPTPRWGARHK